MKQTILHAALVVRDYDEAIEFFCGKLHFELVEDTDLGTDDFWRDFHEMSSIGIKFVREPKQAAYGTVAVFEDLYGNLWDLVELKQQR